jgi:hypothetical protein
MLPRMYSIIHLPKLSIFQAILVTSLVFGLADDCFVYIECTKLTNQLQQHSLEREGPQTGTQLQ